LKNPLTPAEEIRNRTYNLIFADDLTLDMTIALGHACRTTRAKYLPLHFRMVELRVHIKHLTQFLDACYPLISLFSQLPMCQIHLMFGRNDGVGHS
jgi:hypothetical protein